MIEIARGKTGQADVVAGYPFCDQRGIEGDWGYGIVGGDNVVNNGWPEDTGWLPISTNGAVSVPLNAPLGEYLAHIYTGTCAPPANPDPMMPGEPGIMAHHFNFEVVCMTAQITATEIDRDETHYHLSCTATPQGGTAPYQYEWSSPITGSSVISGQTAQTLVVKIPIGATGNVSVVVTDDAPTMPCTATASFEVCGMVCDFSPALVAFPASGTTGDYIYDCIAQVTSGDPPYTYSWSPTPTMTNESGSAARFSFPDDEEYSIHLSVRDSSSCEAFKTRKVGGYDFLVSTTPSGVSAGDPGATTRDLMKFVVEVEATATDRLPLPPPPTVTLEFRRPATNESTTATATLVPGSNPPRYVLSAGWDVTKLLGRYHIKVQGRPSSSAQLKIDKREQIVQVANSWIGASQAQLGVNANCNDLTAKVYTHVGLSLSGFTDAQYAQASSSCSGDGCLLFYSAHLPTGWNSGHVAIADGDDRININSLTGGSEFVTKESKSEGVPDRYMSRIDSLSTVDLDED